MAGNLLLRRLKTDTQQMSKKTAEAPGAGLGRQCWSSQPQEAGREGRCGLWVL